VSDNNNKDDDKNIIRFPNSDKKKTLEKSKKQKTKSENKKLNDLKNLENQYRAQYRAERAKEQSQRARKTSTPNGKTPFVNWDKIPPFTRYILGALLLIQIILSFLISPADKVAILYYFGFVPAMYNSTVEWSWSALISPFTSLIIHSGWIHLGFNMAMMLIMGVFFERELGSKRTAIFFIFSGLAGNLAYLLLNTDSTIPVIGASGAINGLFAVTFMIMIEKGMLGPEAQKRGSLPFILIWSTIMILLGLVTSDTSWQSHIGGFIGGAGLFTLWKNGKVRF